MSTATEALPVESGQAEEAPVETTEQQAEGSDQAQKAEESSDDGWSIKDVPFELRGHLEKAIKPFQSKYTKAKQEYQTKEKEWNEKLSKMQELEQLPTQLEKLKEFAKRAVLDDQFREQLRQRAGYKKPDDRKFPEGWDSPEAVEARQLLLNEFSQHIMHQLSPVLSKAQAAAQYQEQQLVNEAQTEIVSTKESLAKEGMPMTDDMLNACIGIVRDQTSRGKSVSLREAYDLLFKPAFSSLKELEASKQRPKLGVKPMTPTATGSRNLTAEEKLKQAIDQLPIHEEGW